MFPGIFEWAWDKGHLIFMGIVWLVIAALLAGVAVVLVRTVTDLKREAEADSDSWIGSRNGHHST